MDSPHHPGCATNESASLQNPRPSQADVQSVATEAYGLGGEALTASLNKQGSLAVVSEMCDRTLYDVWEDDLSGVIHEY